MFKDSKTTLHIRIPEHAADECAPVRRTLYSLNFILTAVSALVTYFNTPFLINRGVPISHIGLVYMGSAVMSIIALFLAPLIFTRFGNYRTLIGLSWLTVATLALMAVLPGASIIVGLFIVLGIISTITYLLLDMILAGSMPIDRRTGATRGLYLTVADVAWFIFPVVAGIIIAIGEFELLYLIAAAMIVPLISIARRNLRSIRSHTYHVPRLDTVVRLIVRDKDIRGVFAAQLLLRIFFASMVIYTPLYLVETLGISFSAFGSIISIAMLAYITFEWPLGFLADFKWGEKELMTGGFLVIGLSTCLISLFPGTSVLIWGAIFFLTRIGATMVDVTTESYFFKHVNGEGADIVSAFRMLGPLAYVIAPAIGAILLLIMPLQYIFVGFAALMILGIPMALSIKDTR
jgi:MFS family permease